MVQSVLEQLSVVIKQSLNQGLNNSRFLCVALAVLEFDQARLKFKKATCLCSAGIKGVILGSTHNSVS